MSEPVQIGGLWAFPPDWVEAKLREAMEKIEIVLVELEDRELARSLWSETATKTTHEIAQLLVAAHGAAQ